MERHERARGHVGADGLAYEVMAEVEAAPLVDDDVGPDGLVDEGDESARPGTEYFCHVGHSEGAAEHRGRLKKVKCCKRQRAQAPANGGPKPVGDQGGDERGHAVLHPDGIVGDEGLQ